MKTLVIGYGNSLRTDDGFGWHVASDLLAASWSTSNDVRILQEFQLTPELAYDLAETDLVLFVDVREDHDTPPGTLATRNLAPTQSGLGITSHHVTPEALLGLCESLFDRVPRAIALEAAASEFSEGTDLTPPLREAIPQALAQVKQLLETSSADPTH